MPAYILQALLYPDRQTIASLARKIQWLSTCTDKEFKYFAMLDYYFNGN